MGSNNTTRYFGVYADKRTGNFVAQIYQNGTKYYLGVFDCALKAAMAYNKKAVELFGQYANLNEVI